MDKKAFVNNFEYKTNAYEASPISRKISAATEKNQKKFGESVEIQQKTANFALPFGAMGILRPFMSAAAPGPRL